MEGGYLCLTCEFHVMSVCLSPVVSLSDGLMSSLYVWSLLQCRLLTLLVFRLPPVHNTFSDVPVPLDYPQCFLGCFYTLSHLLVLFCAPVIRGQRNTMLAYQVETERDLGSLETGRDLVSSPGTHRDLCHSSWLPDIGAAM